ncbi:porin [uncultured Massilia sp.]|uniref:porin n=1 Tax=uncultured Massilia sp. TaxID=169973 RepID=UPI0025E4CE05|nr:porin [uncultured Massilia sp.]
MKTSINKGALAMLAILSAVTAPAVRAQTQVQVYGLIDAAFEHLNNTAPNGAGVTRMPGLSGGQFPSRIGFRGTEELGGGLKAVFTLENGFQPDTGGLNQGGRLFGRQAWVGLAGDWGLVSLGRTYSMLYFTFFDTDVIGPAQMSIGALDLLLPNLRNDNSISYKGTFNGVTVGAGYTLGRDASAAGGPSATNCGGENAADSKACRGWNAMLAYDTKGWGVTAGYDTYNGGTGAAAAFGPNRSNLSDTRWHLGAYGRFGPVKVGGGLVRRDNEGNAATPRSDLAYVGASWGVSTAVVLDAQVARLDFKSSANDTNMYLLRANYNFSKRTVVYAGAGRVRNGGAAAVAVSAGATVVAGGSQNGLTAGIRHAF